MAGRILIKRGNKANIPVLAQGEPGFAMDTKEFFIGGSDGNKKVGVENPWGDSTNALRPASKATAAGMGINANTWTKVSFLTEVYDNLGNFDPSAGMYRFTVATGQKGIYLITAVVTSTSVPSAATFEMFLYVNGTQNQRLDYRSGVGAPLSLTGSAAVSLNVNDYVEIYVMASASINIISTESIFEVVRVA